jgi:hypothetical protein
MNGGSVRLRCVPDLPGLERAGRRGGVRREVATKADESVRQQ